MTASRLERVRDGIASANIDALLVTSPANRRYVSGFTGSNGWLLLTANHGDRPKLATDFRYTQQATAQAAHFNSGRSGARIEDIVILRSEGATSLSEASKYQGPGAHVHWLEQTSSEKNCGRRSE